MQRGALILALVTLGCRGKDPPVITGTLPAVRATLAHPDAPDKVVEYFWARPRGDGPWPALVYIHGHRGDRAGARPTADDGALEAMARRGAVAVAVSQPGYGGSDGPPDYCGPFTQAAVRAVINELRARPYVDPDRIGLVGVSRGAIVAANVETQDPRLAAAVLIVGWYDFEKAYHRLAEIGERDGGEAWGIARNIAQETGGTPEALRARSAILGASRIRTPTLVINGAKDFRMDSADGLAFARAIEERGVPARAILYPQHGHGIPYADRRKEVDPFLETYLDLSPSDP